MATIYASHPRHIRELSPAEELVAYLSSVLELIRGSFYEKLKMEAEKLRREALVVKSESSQKSKVREAARLDADIKRFRELLERGEEFSVSIRGTKSVLASICSHDYSSEAGPAESFVYHTAVKFLPLVDRLNTLLHLRFAHPEDARKRAQKIYDIVRDL